MTEKLTVVVTNFRRPDFLARCLHSIVNAGVKNIVCSSMDPDERVLALHREYAAMPGIHFKSTILKSDLGCNELWLRGVYQAETEYVLILHDDDFLHQSFGQTYHSTIQPQLDRGCGFASWRGASIDEKGERTAHEYFSGKTQCVGTLVLRRILMAETTPAISPVVSVFRKNVVIRALKECRENFTEAVSFSRPGMMLGNELMIYLRHVEKYSSWLYVNEVLTYYGSHPESETIFHIEHGTSEVLQRGYDWARKYFDTHRGVAFTPAAQFLHVWSDYEPELHGDKVRHAEAARTWQFQNELGETIPLHVTNEMMERTSQTVLSDPRPVPFVRDLLDWGCQFAQDEDVVLLTNRDVCVTVDAMDKIRWKLRKGDVGAAFAWRRTFNINNGQNYKTVKFAPRDGGVDLFAIRPWWWEKYRGYMPDMLLGCESWDWILRIIMAEAHPGLDIEMDDLIYHAPHAPFWKGEGIRRVNPGQRYNISLAKNYFHCRGQYREMFDNIADSKVPASITHPNVE